MQNNLSMVRTLDKNCKSGNNIGWENCNLGLEKVGKWFGMLLCLRVGTLYENVGCKYFIWVNLVGREAGLCTCHTIY